MSDLKETMPEYWEATRPFHRNAICLTADPEAVCPVGSSRLGGLPDFSPETRWPRRENGSPMSFLAQFNLSECAPYDLGHELPDHGMLYFFADADQAEGTMPWGFDPEDADGFRVLYDDSPAEALTPAQAPAELEREEDEDRLVFEQTALRFHCETELPDLESDLVQELSFSEEEEEAYYQYLDGLDEESDTRSKLLGHANVIQSGMELECESVTCGINMGEANPGIRSTERANHWRLLFQLDSEEDLGMMWGDMGKLFFWIRQEDLKARRFEKSWMILQCC